jgi:isopentenyl-diphosphate delta-isomerase
MTAHRLGQLHLAISVFVFDETGALLIQQRARGKYHCGGQWANTCCSHPHWGEPPHEAAQRRLREELGLVTPLRATTVLDYAADVTDGLVEHERVHVFSGRLPRAFVRCAPDPEEVGAISWAEPHELMRDAQAHPDRFTPWFRIYLQRWSELGLA